MEGFDTIRVLARRKHKEVCVQAGGKKSAADLLDGATAITGVTRQPVPDDDPVLYEAEAILNLSVPAIFFKKGVSAEQAAFYQAHEFAHYFLDSASGACKAYDIDVTMPEERIPLGIQQVEGYGPRERRECQANVFAREFLLPYSEARQLFLEERLSAAEIAKRIGVSIRLVHQQLSQALLVPELGASSGPSHKVLALDVSQRTAAEAESGPHLIEAGPGTGKTRTLIARIDWLLNRGVDPSSILVLTFSNKAAEELRERVAVSAPNAAPAIWAGTFHAFGLEVLRKFGYFQDLDSHVRLVDPGNALLLLEERLPSLPLKHYLNLYEPAFVLRDVLTAISRAKDELICPDKYREFGEKMLAAAGDDADMLERAERAMEVADVFAIYEDILQKEGVVDFADLVVRPVKLLQEYPEVGEALREQYKWILVDEYQDVNRASGVLLKLLAGDGKTLWVVGDARQSIYRFRGASPLNIRSFEKDFPGAIRLSLDVNYRSQEPVAQLFEAFATKMKVNVGGLSAEWRAERGDQGGKIVMEVATDLEAEAVGLAEEIRQRRSQGIAYRDQAILCRSHNNLGRFASRLEAQGIPVLYLGDFFERPEVRDMLALISLTCEPKRGGLLRVASFPEYNVPLEDARAVLTFAASENIYPLQAMTRLDEITGLTEIGHQGLALLGSHLAFVQPGTPAAILLSEYLFTQSRYLGTVLADNSVAGECKRLAIFQLLQFAIEYKPSGSNNPRQQILQWIRRLETFGDGKQLRQMPSAADSIDAVRLLTVHASKGLEFSAVYMPALGKAMFPVSRKYNPCPPPDGMLSEDPEDSHDEEEECLFFVGMSRARDVLCFSRAERYSAARTTRASSLLVGLDAHLPSSPDGPPGWRDLGLSEKEEDVLVYLAADYDVHNSEDLDQYIKCPQAYLYQRILGLSGSREDSAYVQFHRAVYSVLRWIRGIEAGTEVSHEEVKARLDAAWEGIGPTNHPYETIYREAADAIIKRAIAHRVDVVELLDADWQVERPGGRIRVRPDHVERGADGLVVRRLRTGRPPKNIDGNIYALYHMVAQELGGGSVDALFLTTDEKRPVPMTSKKIESRLAKYDQAIAGISEGRFPPKPNDRMCPGCPQYFICPVVSTVHLKD